MGGSGSNGYGPSGGQGGYGMGGLSSRGSGPNGGQGEYGMGGSGSNGYGPSGSQGGYGMGGSGSNGYGPSEGQEGYGMGGSGSNGYGPSGSQGGNGIGGNSAIMGGAPSGAQLCKAGRVRKCNNDETCCMGNYTGTTKFYCCRDKRMNGNCNQTNEMWLNSNCRVVTSGSSNGSW